MKRLFGKGDYYEKAKEIRGPSEKESENRVSVYTAFHYRIPSIYGKATLPITLHELL
jgi:hypothetical protein